ncbi:PREDICTED: uncharacterized protein LOC105457202 [Wasmannia auropunctata]|uniref:uncharacterized protein LOC105457202 n=1 Tax=Wasmannia auropunctata TaxID=64793 RepID=UPI0005EE52D3|nr:PREDICTED: uncharacterized protein LOC105457202 [Wasmannia auropunctata]
MYTKMKGDAFISSISDAYTIIIHICSFLEKFLLLYLVLVRFKHLNKKIAPNVLWNEERRERNSITISDVRIMHSMLYDAIEAFNDIYRNPLMLSFISLLLRIVANFSIFREEGLLIGSSFVSPPIMLILFICTICHYTAEEANNIACVLSDGMTKLINSGNTPTKIAILTYFLHKCVSFDAARFFIIDLPLFHSIFAAITTSFIILV